MLGPIKALLLLFIANKGTSTGYTAAVAVPLECAAKSIP